MPRPRPVPLDDVLMDKAECGAICKVEKDRWPAYARRFAVLVAGRRVVRVNPAGTGRYRWLKSAVLAHMHHDLPRDMEPRAGSSSAAGKRSGDLAGFMSRKAGSDSPARYPSAPVRDVPGTSPDPVGNAARPDRGTRARRAS